MRLAVILIWMTMVVCLAVSPWEVKAHLHSRGRFHDLYHWSAFTITTLLLLWDSRRIARIWLCAVAVALAFLTELLENLRFHNPYEWHDVFVDCTGIATGLIVVSCVGALLRPRSPQYSRR